MEAKERIIKLLESTNRNGIDVLVKSLVIEGFFESPASTRFHGCYKGGLAKHSLRVWELLSNKASELKLNIAADSGQKSLPFDDSNIIIAALLHDVCKIGAYIGDEKPYKYNKANPKGHALLSIERVEKFIELTEIEKMAIKYHMGVYGLNEFYKKDDWQTGEYNLRGDDTKTKEERYGNSLANAWYHNPIVKIMYFCDEIATLEEKAAESK